MKTKLVSIIVSLALIAGAGSLTITGCASANKTAYQAATVTQVTVQTALGAWNVYVGSGKATVAQEIKVRAAFNEWQKAMLAVCDAGAVWAAAAQTNAAGATGLQTAYQTALTNLTTIEADFTSLIKSFGVTF
jgi:hypothetical protein